MKKVLTDREREAVMHAADGLVAKETAKVMGISVLTAKNHLANARGKLGATTVAHAVALLLRSEVYTHPACCPCHTTQASTVEAEPE